MSYAVLGHVEWVDFARVPSLPASGAIVHAEETWAEAAGGGAVAAVQLARMAGRATLYTALGDDELGARSRAQLGELGVRVEAATHSRPQRRAFTHVEPSGERTITVLGERAVPRGADPLPFDELDGADAVYFVSGDAASVRAARGARVLVATSRSLSTLAEAEVEIDVLLGSAQDEGERYESGDLDPPPAVVVRTAGAEGGAWERADGTSGRWTACTPAGPVSDTYGAGDSFAAGLTYALGTGRSLEDALAFASEQGANALTRRGAHGAPSGRD